VKLHVAVTAAVACALAMTGCGGSDAPTVRTTSGQSPASVPSVSASTTAPGSSPETPPPPQYELLSKEALRKTLLSLDDMPNGYADTTTKADQVDDAGTFCHYKRPYPNKTFVTRTFTKGSGFSAELVSPAIRQYANPMQAKASMTKLLATLKTCRKFTSDGESLKVAKVKADPVGEMSVTVRLEGSTFTIVQGYSLVGLSMIAVGTGGVTSVDGDVLRPLLQKQVDRYAAAALS
jgi:hypothetical protein